MKRGIDRRRVDALLELSPYSPYHIKHLPDIHAIKGGDRHEGSEREYGEEESHPVLYRIDLIRGPLQEIHLVEYEDDALSPSHDEIRDLLVLNKMDLLKGIPNEIEAIKDRVRFLFPILSFAPLQPISALNGSDIGKLLVTVWSVWKQLQKRVDTSALNTALAEWTKDNEPPRGAAGHFKVLYGTQVSAAPVRFLFFVNRIHGFPETYVSYLKNMIRRDFGFSNVPVEISLRERRRNPSLNERGPSKTEREIRKVMNSSKGNAKGGTSRKPGGKARLGKERERAEKIVRNQKQRRKSNGKG